MNTSIFYHIYPLGLLGVSPHNPLNGNLEEKLLQLLPWLDHMNTLGCDALYLGPVFESCSHGYDTIDYDRVDRRLGSDESLQQFVFEAHKRNINVVLDAVFNHVGREFWAFKDVLAKGQDSKYCDWISGIDFKKKSAFDDPFDYNAWHGHYELVELNLKNEHLRTYLFGVVGDWMQKYRIDGLRLDTAEILDFEFMRALVAHCKSINGDFWIMGEVVQGDYRKWIGPDMLDSVSNYDLHTPIFSAFNSCDFRVLLPILEKHYGKDGDYRNLLLYTFVDNHDVNRAASHLHNSDHLSLLYLLLFTLPGIPSIYYGSEWGIEGKRDAYDDNALRPAIDFSNRKEFKYFDFEKAIGKLISIRKSNAAFLFGDFNLLLLEKKVLIFSRRCKSSCVFVIVNSDSSARKIVLQTKMLPKGNYIDVLHENYSIALSEAYVSIGVQGENARILKFQEKL